MLHVAKVRYLKIWGAWLLARDYREIQKRCDLYVVWLREALLCTT